MGKAFDRISWSYICLVLRKMVFDEIFIDLVWRILATIGYSIIVNGKRYGFFDSTRGLKKGDPLSSALFILGVEVLYRSLNKLHSNPDYHGFCMERRGPQVNHLSFAYDIILFTSGRHKTLKILIKALKECEEISGKLINEDNSHFMLHSNAFNRIRDRIKRFTGFKQKKGPITYLGYPLFVGRPGNIYFSDLVNKVVCRIKDGKPNNLIMEGKQFLQRLFYRQYTYIYYVQSNPVKQKWDTGESLTWKKMFMKRKHVEKHIQWKLKTGNWLGNDPLSQFSNNSKRMTNVTVDNFWEERKWDWNELIEQHLPDQAIWKLNNHGNFTRSSAWEEIREKRVKYHFNSLLWHKNIPFKVSFLLWRTLRGKLPTNDKLNNFDIDPSKCFCRLDNARTDNIQHILSQANSLRKYGVLLQQEQGFSMDATHCSSFFNTGGQQRPTMQPSRCFYRPPLSSYAGTYGITDAQANMVIKQQISASNSEAAILGLTWALKLGYRNIVLERDSQLVVKWINPQASPQWNLIIQLGRLQNFICQTYDFKYTHVYREENLVADAFSKQSHETTNPQVYFSHQQLPKEARVYDHLDLMEMPSLRRKKIKRIKDPP
ncbi:uncharacterized protein LOC107024957 [Solanum pennellii]|uniref:Uncharacterized protein LOC107024957 n=1 Tax=Solanum pennellii TaxID=28526 RepID=A0ABM1H782_SOLPN|nr:uncharacterized protein LOC107024957 [Solanum pennellii]